MVNLEGGDDMEQQRATIRLMGTIIDLVVEHDSPDQILAEAARRLKIYEQRFSANDPRSELMQINHLAGTAPLAVHPELFHLIKMGKAHSEAADSQLNIAIGPLVQTWRIGFSDAKVPTDREIQQLFPITDPKKILLSEKNQTVFLQEKGMALDLGALAKGYIADLLVTYFKEVGVSSALINLGGNVVVLGPARNHADFYWRIGIQNPLLPRNHYSAVLKIRNQSTVTSGVYERHLEAEGKQYHHILDPKSGYPIETEVVSLTIVSDASITGEIWTSRLFGQSPEAILAALERSEEIEGILITKDGKITYSRGLEGKMLLQNTA